MKKLILLLWLMVIGITFSSCGTLGGVIYNSSKWNEYQIMPSKIVTNGDVFFSGKWKSSSDFRRRTKLGYLYINPNKRVAIYMYPKNTFGAFKVSIVDEFGVEVPVKDYSIVKDDPLQQF